MAVGAVLNDGRVFPQKRSALFRVAGVAGLGDGVLHHQARASRTVRVVAVGAANFAFEDRMPRKAMKLGALILVATETDFRLGKFVQHLLLRVMHLVTIRARHALLLVCTA